MWHYCNNSNNYNGFFYEKRRSIDHIKQKTLSDTVDLKQIIIDNYLYLIISPHSATFKHGYGTKRCLHSINVLI